MRRAALRRKTFRLALSLSLAGVLAGCAGAGRNSSSNDAAAVSAPVELLGVAHLRASSFDDTPLGGLSGLAYLPESGGFLAISDDRAERAAARFYALEIDFTERLLRDDGVRVVGVTRLTDAAGAAFAEGRIDPEGIVAAESLWIASEGNARLGIGPFIGSFDVDGRQTGEIDLPASFAPTAESGVRDNLALESLTASPGGRWLFSATENALHQDGPSADPIRGSPSRLLRIDLAHRTIDSSYLYWTDPVHAVPEPAGGLAVAGLVELLALDDRRLLALERSFSMGVGTRIRLYLADLGPAEALDASSAVRDPDAVRPVAKTLLFDLADFDVPIDNFEGLAFGPDLGDGRRSLFMVSDDNFNPLVQRTLLVAFAIDPALWSPQR